MNTLTNLAHRLHDSEVQLLHNLRHARRQRPPIAVGELSLGDRIADAVAATVGSWRFIIIQSITLIAWMILNVVAWVQHWDPYPFILLNLVLSFQAAYTAPILMMSQNRQAEVDRRNASHDYQVNVKAELEIELLHTKLDALREQEIMRLTEVIEALCARLDAKPAQPG